MQENKLNKILLLIFLLSISGCVGPNRYEVIVIGLNMIFGVVFTSYLLSKLIFFIISKIKKGELFIPKHTINVQLFILLPSSILLSLILFIFYSNYIFEIYSSVPVGEWLRLQFASFLVFPIIFGYILIAVLITSIIPKLKKFYLFIIVLVHIVFVYFISFLYS